MQTRIRKSVAPLLEQQKKEIEYLNQDNDFIKQQLREYRDIINILKKNHDD